MLQGSGTPTDPEHKSQIVTTSESSLTKAHLVALKKTQSQWDVPTAAFVMNQSRIEDILLWAQDEVDQLTMREMLETGVKYVLWGSVKLITASIIPRNVVYAFSEPEYVGRIPILKDLTVRLTETANKLEKGLFMFEFIGIYIASQKAVGKLILEYNDGDPLIDTSDIDDVDAREGSISGYGSLEETK